YMIRERGYQGSVVQLRRTVATLRPPRREAFLRLHTFPGEDYGKCRVMVRRRGARALETVARALRRFAALHNAVTTTQATR
ncbi:MAG TPA: hypothetical protein VM912_19100, partial [Terriglobales bacterium]|nr:hypothetical protein [Terriglobales bacterium]